MPSEFEATSPGKNGARDRPTTGATPEIGAANRVHAKLADSAGVLKESAVEQTQSADRRTEFAAVRTVLAAERTYAAWIRTA